MQTMFRIFWNLLAKIREPWLESARWMRPSYAQEGEDLVLDRLMGNVPPGFYVEIGSHHPFRFSNTYLFYRRGWSGICIDPLPNSRALFNKWRPRDLALELGVSSISGNMNYYLFNEPALNTLDARQAEQRDGSRGYKIVDVRNVVTLPLSRILEEHLPVNTKIDFLSVDAEGFDLSVLQSNDWQKFRPRYIVAECLGADMHTVASDSVACYLGSVGYNPYAKTGHSVIFVEK